jgi:diphthamide synthase subunit DPH2
MIQILQTALIALRRNVTRSMLTMLGIVIGIAAVITMMEIGNGASRQIASSISNMGSNVIMVRSVAVRRAGVAKNFSIVDSALLEHCIREELNETAPRRVCVLHPVKVVVDNFPEDKVEYFELPK